MHCFGEELREGRLELSLGLGVLFRAHFASFHVHSSARLLCFLSLVLPQVLCIVVLWATQFQIFYGIINWNWLYENCVSSGSGGC